MKTQIIATAFALASTAASAQELARTLPDAADAVAPALAAYATEDLFGSVWTDETLSIRDRALGHLCGAGHTPRGGYARPSHRTGA